MPLGKQRQTGRQAGRQAETERQGDRERETERERERDKEREREREREGPGHDTGKGEFGKAISEERRDSTLFCVLPIETPIPLAQETKTS